MLPRGFARAFASKAKSAAAPSPKSPGATAVGTGGYRLKFDPKAILPHEFGHVRVLSNTTRDAQQSNCSAEMADEHRQQITKLIDDCYKPTTLAGQAPGYEQIWGGTIPMFDIWKRGVSPFDSLRQQVAYMPNTPSSMLFRSSSITSMSSLPVDVVDAFIKNACESGMNVFTNFDAHNDPRNHKEVANSVIKHGGHYQAALSWAVLNADPSIYNVQWAVDFFRECVAMGAHSLYVKDPSGVLTPEMAGCLARQVKEAFPNLPLVFHTHYQTGYSYMTYMEAVKNGANGVECSIGFPDGAGQPYSLTMLRVFEDLGFHTGNPDKAAMTKLSDMCKVMRPLYKGANVMRTPDLSVENSGIAGGQRSILDKELMDAGQPHLIPQVDIEVAKVRAEGGKVCQVTPVADTYAREAMRRLRGGKADRNFVPGFSGILVGEGGLVKEPVNPVKQVRALFERAHALGLQLIKEKALTGAAKADVEDANSKLITAIVAAMGRLAEPTVRAGRRAEVAARVKQLEIISANKALLESLDRKFAQACAAYAMAADPDAQKPSANTAERMAALKAELTTLSAPSKNADGWPVLDQAEYEELLHGKDGSKHLATLIKLVPGVAGYIEKGEMSKAVFAQLLGRAGFITCAVTDLLTPGMPAARLAIEQLEKKEILGTCETPELKEELAVLHACFGKAAIPNLYLNFLRNYRENVSYFPPLYTGHTRAKLNRAPSTVAKVPKTPMHLDIEKRIGSDGLNELVEFQKSVTDLRDRIHSQKASASVFTQEESTEPFKFKRRLAPATVAELQKKLDVLEETMIKKKFETGIAVTYHYVLDDLIKNALAETTL